jgi:hypothetical protein
MLSIKYSAIKNFGSCRYRKYLHVSKKKDSAFHPYLNSALNTLLRLCYTYDESWSSFSLVVGARQSRRPALGA